VYEALVRHFTDYAVAFIARCTHPDLPDTNHDIVAQFVAHGFAGAIKAWIGDSSVKKGDLVDAAVACAPVGGAEWELRLLLMARESKVGRPTPGHGPGRRVNVVHDSALRVQRKAPFKA
jgi:hypothetical protein